jgi:hypothetical protein
MSKYIFRVLRKQWLELEVGADSRDLAEFVYDQAIADDFEVVGADWKLEEVEEVQ